MRETTLVLALGLALTCCGGAAPYGSFVTGREPAQGAIAVDAARELAASFSPEGRAIRFAHDSADAFGRALAAELRKEGFAIHSTPAEADVLLRYVVDGLKGTDMLRTTIYARGRTFSRAYAPRAGGLYPVGPWSVGGADGP